MSPGGSGCGLQAGGEDSGKDSLIKTSCRLIVLLCFIIKVVEYSEISKETSELRTDDGKLTYKAGNICNHFFTRDFLKVFVLHLTKLFLKFVLQRICDIHERELPHHIAKKKIPFTDPETGETRK